MAVPASRDEFKKFCLRNKYSKWYFNIIESALNPAFGKPGAAMGKKWYNNSVEEKYCVPGMQAVNWVLGRD